MKGGALLVVEGAGAGVLLADTGFQNVITTGQIVLGILLALSALVGVFYGAKFKVSYQAAEALATARGEAIEDAKAREQDLQSALAASKEANAQLRAAVEKLEALPNLQRIMELMTANTARTEEARERQFEAMDEHSRARTEQAVHGVVEAVDRHFVAHEKRAAERHQQVIAQGEQVVKALSAIERKINGQT